MSILQLLGIPHEVGMVRIILKHELQVGFVLVGNALLEAAQAAADNEISSLGHALAHVGWRNNNIRWRFDI